MPNFVGVLKPNVYGRRYDSIHPNGDHMPPVADGSFLVVPIMGQSNAAGTAAIRSGIDNDYSGLQHCFMYDATSGLAVPLVNPLLHQDVASRPGTTSLAIQLARCLPSSRPILFVPCSKGSTGMAHWIRGNSVFDTAVTRTNAAMALNPGNKLWFLCWHQGEYDAEAQNANYLQNIKTMRNNLVADINGLEDDTPFIVGTIYEGDANAWKQTINNNIRQFAIDVPAVVCVELTDQAVFDGTHYTAQALETMGNRYFAAINNGLTMTHRVIFDSGTVNTSQIGFMTNDQTYHGIVTLADNSKALRQNVWSGVTANDPVTGKPVSGIQTHWAKWNNFYTKDVDNYIALEMDYSFDDCFWSNDAGIQAPGISGKLFILDADIVANSGGTASDSNGMYFSLNNFGYLQIIASNGPGPWQDWTQRPGAWRTETGAVANNIKLKIPDGNAAFYSDGRKRTLRLEVDRHNGGNAQLGRARVILNGDILKDWQTTVLNCDANGYFPIPKEAVPKGLRLYAKTEDNGPDAQDSTNDPKYKGAKCGNNTYQYRSYKG